MMAVEEKALEWHAGIGTSPSMWQMVSEALAGTALPEPLNAAIYALCEGRALVAPKAATPQMIATAWQRDPLACDVDEANAAYVYGEIWKAMVLEACEKPTSAA